MYKKLWFIGAFAALMFVAATAQAVEIINNDKMTLKFSGYVDVYLEYLSDSGDDESKFRLSSGGLSSSRIVLQGTYQLNGGNEAFFRTGISAELDNGEVSNKLRRAYIGLRGDWGELSFGRQVSLSYQPVGYADPNWTGAYSMMNSMVWYYAPYKKNNSIQYITPTYSHFTGALMYATGEDGSKNGRFYGARLTYSSGPLFVSLISEKEYTQDISNPSRMRHSLTNYLAVIYRMGNFVPTFVFSTYNGYYAFPPYVGFESEGWATQVGFRWYVNDKNMINFSYVHRQDEGDNNAIGTADGITAGIIHHMTSKTDLYVLVSHVWNDDSSNLAYPVTWSSIPNSGQDPTGIAVGFRYAF